MTDKPKRVIITAAADGIGKVIAEEYLKLGHKVAVCDIQKDKVKEFAEANPDNLLCEVCNVGDDDDLAGWLDRSLEFLGGCDTLVNNAGIAGPTAPIEEMSLDDVRAVDAESWLPLAREIETPFFSWDTRAMPDGDLDDAVPRHLRQHGQEAVHAVERQEDVPVE